MRKTDMQPSNKPYGHAPKPNHFYLNADIRNHCRKMSYQGGKRIHDSRNLIVGCKAADVLKVAKWERIRLKKEKDEEFLRREYDMLERLMMVFEMLREGKNMAPDKVAPTAMEEDTP